MSLGARSPRLVLELPVVVAIVAALQAWRARDLLPVDERTPAPPLELRDLEGRNWSTADLAGLASTGASWKVRGYPTYYILDARGNITARDVGFTTALGLWLRTLGA